MSSEFLRGFQRSSQRPSQRQISLSEALSPVAPKRVAPWTFSKKLESQRAKIHRNFSPTSAINVARSWAWGSAERIWGELFFGTWRIVGKLQANFSVNFDGDSANFSVLLFQGFRPPQKIHAQNSRPNVSAFLSNFAFSKPFFSCRFSALLRRPKEVGEHFRRFSSFDFRESGRKKSAKNPPQIPRAHP